MIISVVIPCRNEVNHIGSCVEAIFNSVLPENISLEVLIVDGKSDDGTKNEITELQKKYPNLQLILNPLRITPVAFNLGIKSSIGDYIQIIGARQVIASDYLARGVQCLQSQSEVWCVGGKVENSYANMTSRIIARSMDTPFGVGGGNFRIQTKSGFVDTVGTPMYPRFVFERIGLFDEALVRNQDDEFNYRVTQAGGKIFLDVDMHLNYEVRGSFAKLYRQYFQYGYWKVYVNRKHHTITSVRQLAPAFFVLFVCIGWLGVLISPFLLVVYGGILLLYLITAKLVALKKAELWRHIYKYIFCFLTLHFGYGFGYLKGIYDFLILRRKSGAKSQTMLSR